MQNKKQAVVVGAAHAEQGPSIAGQAAFERLGLSTEEITSIRHQGFISREKRGRGTIVFKLRFRLDGRQRVKYLGTDAAQAALVQQELEKHQRGRQINQQLRELNRETAKLLRESKHRLEPFVAQAGLRFHGRAIRRPRRVIAIDKNQPTRQS